MANAFTRLFQRLFPFQTLRPSSLEAASVTGGEGPFLESARMSCQPAATPLPSAREVYMVVILFGNATADLMCEDIYGHVRVLRWNVPPDTPLAVAIKVDRVEEKTEVFFQTYRSRPHRRLDDQNLQPRIRVLGWFQYRDALPRLFPGIEIL